MSLENLVGNDKFISNLVNTNPTNTDPVSQGDDHVRGIKNVLLNTFPNITGAVTLTQQQFNALATLVTVPIGAVIDFAGSTPPTNYLALPFAPSNVSRSTYAALFAAIAATWGNGDGSTTFGLPYVIDGGATLNHATAGGNTVGQVISHTHTVNGSDGVNHPDDRNGSEQTWYGAATTTAATGGANNIAAGSYFRKCIRYQ